MDGAASVFGIRLRVTRLGSTGTTPAGASNSAVTDAFIRVAYTPEYDAGDEVVVKNAQGVQCVAFKAADTVKQVSLQIALCNPEPEITELLGGGAVLLDGADPVGYSAPDVGEDPQPNGVGIEVWSDAIVDGVIDADLPYFHFVFPRAFTRADGERALENGAMANVFSGWGKGNLNFGNGPDNLGEFPAAASAPYHYYRTAIAPPAAADGYVVVPVQA